MSHSLRGFALAVLAAALWGLAPVATKGALAGYAPELISVVRLGLAALLFRVLGGTGTRWWSGNGWSWISGIALGADFIMYNYGLRLTDAGVSGLVINIELVTTIGLAVWLLDERLTRRRTLGSAVTLLGAIYVGLNGAALGDLVARDRLIGNGLVMLAGVAWSVFAVAQRKVPRQGNLFQLLAPIFFVAALTAVPPLLLPSAWHNPTGVAPTLMLLVLVLACTIGVYAAYARSQELVDVSVLAIVLASIPVFAIAFAWLLLGEPVTMRVIVGGAIILAGVLLITIERPATTAVERAQ
ncbi:MAG: DMT family transporter [Deltaproteobacteria bacterium]|nr:DMT family transporter [Deltaproteobacteria bacterium]MBI3386468.1 DMT family transporter [Deltaproteobacteria bacterium]